MHTYSYYRVRSMVRFLFWGTIALGLIWLVVSSVSSWENYECVETDVVVQPLDTMWSIAEEYCEGNIEVAVSDLISSNGSSTVVVGQVVKVRNK